MAEHLTKEQIEELQSAFEIFDKDNDGVITIQELGEVVRSLGQVSRPEDVQEMIRELDVDKSGTVDFHEFLIMMGRKMTAGEEEDELRQAFHVFDNNNDGFIRLEGRRRLWGLKKYYVFSLVELKAAMASLGENMSSEDVERMMNQADSNSDGLVSFEEFATMMNK